MKWTQGIKLWLQHVLISTCHPPMVTMEAYKSNRLISYFKNFLYEIHSISLKPWWMFEVMPFCNTTCWKQEWKSSFRNCDITYIYLYLYCVQFIVITIIIMETNTTTVIIVMFVVSVNPLKVKLYFFVHLSLCTTWRNVGKWRYNFMHS